MTASKAIMDRSPAPRGEVAWRDESGNGPEDYYQVPEIPARFFVDAERRARGEVVQKAKPGRPRLARPKEAINIRLSPDVLDAFRSTGPGWQTRIDQALRQHLKDRLKARGLED